MEILNIARQFGSWAVTDYGLEHLGEYIYEISWEQIKDRHDGVELSDDDVRSWPMHMATTKDFVNMDDFMAAWLWVRENARPTEFVATEVERRPTPTENANRIAWEFEGRLREEANEKRRQELIAAGVEIDAETELSLMGFQTITEFAANYVSEPNSYELWKERQRKSN